MCLNHTYSTALIMVEYLRLSEASQSTSVLAYYVLSHPLCAQSELGLGKFVGVLVLRKWCCGYDTQKIDLYQIAHFWIAGESEGNRGCWQRHIL